MPTPSQVTAPQQPLEPIPFNRLQAVDLRSLPEAQMQALTGEAIRRGCSLPELLGALIDEVSLQITAPLKTAAA